MDSTLFISFSVGLFVVLVVILVMMYNTLIGRKNDVENASSSIDAMLRRRYDLIPNLVDAVKHFMEHETGLMTQLTELRTTSYELMTQTERVQLDKNIRSTLGNVMVVAENYPELKSSGNMIHLQETLNEVEGQIAAARRSFNAAITEYNNGIEMFPLNVVAAAMGLRQQEWFEIENHQREVASVKGLFK